MLDFDKEKTLDIVQTVKYATTAHAGQVDKLGVPYIEHPKEVAKILISSPLYRTLSPIDKQNAVKVALLHDVVEDTEVTLEDLAEAGYSEKVIRSVGLLTYDKRITREEYYKDILDDPIARLVKVADLIHNNLPARTNFLDDTTRERLVIKYAKAKEILLLPEEVEFFGNSTK